MSILTDRLAALSAEQRALLAKRLKSKLEGGQKPRIKGRSNTRGNLPLSFTQRRLWILDQLDPGNPCYNIPSAFRLKGLLDVGALEQGLNEITSRHESLRTAFATSDEGKPVQRVAPSLSLSLPLIDLRHLRPAERESEARRLINHEVKQPFDLGRAPLWKASLLRLGEQEHLLLLNHHHVIFDGWSLGVLIRELAALYEGFAMGRPSPLPDLPVQYADYAMWQREWFRGEVAEKQMAYWKRQLAGSLPILELPTDRPRPAVQTFRGAWHSVLLPRALYEKLKELSRQEEVTLFMTLLAAFKTLLHRYTGQEDVIVGFPISGRNQQEIQGLIGAFVNTLALRSDLSENHTFRDLLKRVRDMALGAYANQDLPFDMLVEALQPERNLSHNPLFQVLFSHQNAVPMIEQPSLSWMYQAIDGGTAKFDLSLDIFEGPEGPTCIFEYNTDLFNADKIEQMAGHFQALLEGIVAEPTLRLSDFPLLTSAEQQQLLGDWNSSRADRPQMCIHGLFEAQARSTPDAVAVVYEGERLTYRELDHRANQLAHHLRALGVRAETPVGICMPRSLDMVVATLSVLKAGGAYVPLDPTYPRERLAYMLENTRASVLITHQALLEHLPDYKAAAICLDSQWADIARESRESPATEATPDSLAYVIYTSGSTGTPKGTMITHRSLVNAYLGWEEQYGLRFDGAAHLQMASFSFDVCTGDLVRALCSGGKLVLCPHDYLMEAEQLYSLLLREQVNCAEFVPAVLRNLVQYLEETGQTLDFMRLFVVGSDAWRVSEYRKLLRFCGQATRLINSYGLTEATIDSSYFEGETDHLPADAMVPIGRPFPNTRIYLLDKHLQPVPVGVPGEMYIAGAGLARGYVNRPDLTAERFIETPFGHLYKTGDLGRYLCDGNIELVGRADQQIKLRGYRIELGEIEATLIQHPSVRESVVIARDDSPGGRQVVAYVVPQGERMPAPRELRTFLKQQLPEYMVPSAFVTLADLPLTANGKVNRRALPAPDARQLDFEDHYIAPRTLTEGMLSDIWSQAFNRSRVSIYDDFFELGGHSLLAIQIMSQIRRSFGVDLPLNALFQTSTVAGLAAAVAERQGRQAEHEAVISSFPTIVPDRERLHEPFPLTAVQQAYWIGRSEAFELGNVSTHSYDEYEFENLDLARFTRAWNRLIKRHGMLRAVVLPDGTQRILEQVPDYEIKVQDLRGFTETEIDSRVDAIRERMAHQILRTDRWPVFELCVSLVDTQRARIHLSTDALVFDAWSFVVLLKELMLLHEHPQAELPALAPSFRDYVLTEIALRDSEQYRRSRAYWHSRLPDIPPAPELPAARNADCLTQPRFTRLHSRLEPDTWRRLKKQATQMGLTASGILLAAYAEVLTAWSKSPCFTLNLTFLNRLPVHPQVNEIVGEFTSTTLLAVDNSAQVPFNERARRIQEQLWADLEHHHISGVEVLRELNRVQGGINRAKMPVVFTSALTLPIPDRETSPIPMRPVYSITQTSQVWLDCGVWEESGALLCNWDVVKEAFPPGLLEDMFDAYVKILRRLADNAAAWHEPCLRMIPASQLQLLAEVNATGALVPAALLHTTFAEQATLRPQQTAVVTSQRSLSYAEVYSRSNQVGRRLREFGARPNQLVGVVMEKGWEQVIGVLGVLQSGAAYLPIDPELPQERTWYLLEHGGVSLVLTQSAIDKALRWPQNVQRFCVDTGDFAEVDDRPLTPAQGPEDLAYVIFTSGSTGLPKGVMIDHRGAMNTIADLNDRFGVTPQDRVFALSALNFDLSVYDIFGTLAAGGTIVMPDGASRKDPAHWSALAEQAGVTIWNSVPALMAMLVEYTAGRGGRLCDSLRLVMLSGDWIPLSLPEQIRALCAGVQIMSLGGATEASIWSILYPIGAVDPAWPSIPYGRPLLNQTFHVLNEFLDPCPVWVPGQLLIGGIGLAKGYWRDEKKSCARFIVHPRTGERLYRTGDLGRCLPDGNIEFMGREDFQVKIQGHRIELGEVEAALAQHPLVREAVVVAVGEQKGSKRLVAYLISRDAEITVDREQVRTFLHGKLPAYMVPAALVVLRSLPLTANGKVDRKALPAVDLADSETLTASVPPRTPAETHLASMWCDLLGLEQVSITDNFFTLGGDSLLAVRMVLRIRDAFAIELPLRKVFESPTVAALAETLAAGIPIHA